MGRWGDLFSSHEAGLFGPPVGRHIATGKNAGKFRPGRRSTEKKLAKLRYDQALRLKKAGQTALTPGTNPIHKAGGIAINPVKSGGGANRFTGALTPGRPAAPSRPMFMMGMGDDPIVLDPGAPIDPGAAGSAGLGTTPGATNGNPDPQPNYTGNGKVWLSDQAVQMTWGGWRPIRDAAAANNTPVQGAPAPMMYPDGTPIVGRVWLPAIDLTGAGYTPYTLQVGDQPAYTGIVGGQRAHAPTPTWGAGAVPGLKYKGTHAYLDSQMAAWNNGMGPAPWGGGAEPWGPRAITDGGKNLNDGTGALVTYYLYASFDWRGVDPTTAAYPFVYDYLATDGSLLTWSSQPADLWLSDRSPISNASVFHLPVGSPLLCVDFMDSLATGAHGMPQVIDAAGVLHIDQFRQWAAAQTDPNWATLTQALSGSPFICATIYDVVDAIGPAGAIAPQPVASTPAPAVGTGLPQPIGYDANGNPIYGPTPTGYDAGGNPIYGPTTGGGYPGGGYVPPYGGGGYPPPDYAGGGYYDPNAPDPYADMNAPQFIPYGGGSPFDMPDPYAQQDYAPSYGPPSGYPPQGPQYWLPRQPQQPQQMAPPPPPPDYGYPPGYPSPYDFAPPDDSGFINYDPYSAQDYSNE